MKASVLPEATSRLALLTMSMQMLAFHLIVRALEATPGPTLAVRLRNLPCGFRASGWRNCRSARIGKQCGSGKVEFVRCPRWLRGERAPLGQRTPSAFVHPERTIAKPHVTVITFSKRKLSVINFTCIGKRDSSAGLGECSVAQVQPNPSPAPARGVQFLRNPNARVAAFTIRSLGATV